jgi:hypothetical protein
MDIMKTFLNLLRKFGLIILAIVVVVGIALFFKLEEVKKRLIQHPKEQGGEEKGSMICEYMPEEFGRDQK